MCSAQPYLIPYPVQVHADARMIQSVLYASKLSLRFPRVEAVRWDKSPVDIQTVAEVWDLVNRQKDGVGACSELVLETCQVPALPRMTPVSGRHQGMPAHDRKIAWVGIPACFCSGCVACSPRMTCITASAAHAHAEHRARQT